MRDVYTLLCRQRRGESEETASDAETDRRAETEPRDRAAAAIGDDRASQRPAAGGEGQDVDGRQIREESLRRQRRSDAEEMPHE